MRAKAAIVALLALVLGACSTYREHLNRGQRLYDENEFERALAIWRVIEDDMDSLSRNDQARYTYLRGMTDYRLNFRPDARHWLAISKAIDEQHPGGLTADWKSRLEEALADLNQDVYGGAEPVESDQAGPTDPPGSAPPVATEPVPAQDSIDPAPTLAP